MRNQSGRFITASMAILLGTLFAASTLADPESVFAENDDGGQCNNGIVDNVIEDLPFQLWVKDSHIDDLDVTDDGQSVDADFEHIADCDMNKGSKTETYHLYLVCADMYAKENTKPQSFSATGFFDGKNVGTDSFRWSDGDVSDSEMDACCVALGYDLFDENDGQCEDVL